MVARHRSEHQALLARWIAAGLLAPLAILAHEAGHALVATLRGCALVVLHWAATSIASCSNAGEALQLAAGPLASWLLVAAGWLANRGRLRPEGVIVAVCASGRALYAIDALVTTSSGTDEEHLAHVLDVPVAALVVPQVVLAVVVFAWAVRLVRRHDAGRDALAGIASAAAVAALYLFVVGPKLLP
ncbi:MAG TPA: hypothetical protein VGG74_23440 [Kofleriaceae bacterium]